MQKVRLGIIGYGLMGRRHAEAVLRRRVRRCVLTAVCDRHAHHLQELPAGVQRFTSSAVMARSGAVDAVLICTPHYDHPVHGCEALAQGLHVLVEKPLAVHKADALRLLATPRRPDQVFAIMLNQRTDPRYRYVRELLGQGELGALMRCSWEVTDWFRTNAYYAAGGWRATWRGEGGGVLLNQCPHNLDLLQWLTGQPRRVRAFCGFGRWHPIEVEDDVTAYLEYEGGATGVFVTSTGEAPGCNRLEIAGERGRIRVEGPRVTWTRNAVSARAFCRTSPDGFARPATRETSRRFRGVGGQHVEILQNFVAAILDGEPLIAPAAEGLASVELANAMLYSALTETTVTLPLDAEAYARQLAALVRGSPPLGETILRADH